MLGLHKGKFHHIHFTRSKNEQNERVTVHAKLIDRYELYISLLNQ